MFGKKKGQAAMEYLMTYGWAILAVVIVGGVLYYYGVFEPDLPNQGCPNQPVAVEGNAWDVDPASGDLTLAARNNAGEEINITDVTANGQSAGSGVPQVLSIGDQSDEIVIGSALSDIESGDQIDIDLTFTYDGAIEGQTSSCNLVGEA